MVICMKFGQKDGKLDPGSLSEVVAVRESDVVEVSRIGNCDVMVRLDNGEPGRFWDSVEIGDTVISSGLLINAMAERKASKSKGGRDAK